MIVLALKRGIKRFFLIPLGAMVATVVMSYFNGRVNSVVDLFEVILAVAVVSLFAFCAVCMPIEWHRIKRESKGLKVTAIK